MNVLEINDRFGNHIELSHERWNHALRHKVPGLEEMESCIENPIEIRTSKYDNETNLYYKNLDSNYEKYVCV